MTGKVRLTRAAMRGASAMNIGPQGVHEVLLRLTPVDFYKSMTSYSNHTVWHDVYRPATPYGAVYLKLVVIDEVLVVSFKEL